MPIKKGTSSSTSSASSSRASKPNQGWASVHKKQEEYDKEKARREEEGDAIREFFMMPGETATIQLLSDAPYDFDGHSVKDKRGRYTFLPCQLNAQRHCLMCREQIKTAFRGGFKVLDYRGSWDKDKKKFKYDAPIEKVWICNMTMLGLLDSIRTKRKKPLTDMVLEITRTGKGKSTSYNLETAFDDDGVKLAPKRWKEKFSPIDEILAPKTDEQLIDLGFEKPEDND